MSVGNYNPYRTVRNENAYTHPWERTGRDVGWADGFENRDYYVVVKLLGSYARPDAIIPRLRYSTGNAQVLTDEENEIVRRSNASYPV